MWAACVVALGAASGCGDDGQPGFGSGCVSNEQICKVPEGATQMDVQRVLGPAQGYFSDSWMYVCQQIVGQQIAHNDIISVDFDSAGRVRDISGFRMGANASPVPDWPSCATMSASSSGGACASVPVPAPNTTVCQTVTVGGATQGMVNCTDQNGSKWSSFCSGTTCNCSYNDTYVCNCTPTAGKSQCCPGI
jgi:hypothetical protein